MSAAGGAYTARSRGGSAQGEFYSSPLPVLAPVLTARFALATSTLPGLKRAGPLRSSHQAAVTVMGQSQPKRRLCPSISWMKRTSRMLPTLNGLARARPSPGSVVGIMIRCRRIGL